MKWASERSQESEVQRKAETVRILKFFIQDNLIVFASL